MSDAACKLAFLSARSGLALYTICSFLPAFDAANLLATSSVIISSFPWAQLIHSTINRGRRSVASGDNNEERFSIGVFFAALIQSLSGTWSPAPVSPRRVVHETNFLQHMATRMEVGLAPVSPDMRTSTTSFRLGLLTRMYVAMADTIQIVCARCKTGVAPQNIGRYLILGSRRLWNAEGGGARYTSVLPPALYSPVQKAMGFAFLDPTFWVASVWCSTVVPCLCRSCAVPLTNLADRMACMDTTDTLWMGDVRFVPLTDIVGTVVGAKSFAVTPLKSAPGSKRYTFELALSPEEFHTSAKRLSKDVAAHEKQTADREWAVRQVGGFCSWLNQAFLPMFTKQLVLPVWSQYFGDVRHESVLPGDTLVTLIDTLDRAKALVCNFSAPPICLELAGTEIPNEMEIVSLVQEVLKLGDRVAAVARRCTDRFGVSAQNAEWGMLVDRARNILASAGMRTEDIQAVLASQDRSLQFDQSNLEIRKDISRLNFAMRSRGINRAQTADEYLATFAQLLEFRAESDVSVETILAAVTPVRDCPSPHVMRGLNLEPLVRPTIFVDPAVHVFLDESSDDDEI
jgi:hypothetical protein